MQAVLLTFHCLVTKRASLLLVGTVRPRQLNPQSKQGLAVVVEMLQGIVAGGKFVACQLQF